ncbi:MAG: hypothetical protein ACYTGL_05090 [Planctomycetota bacterium]|jgi:hypothetical protein
MDLQEFGRRLSGYRQEPTDAQDALLMSDCVLLLGQLERKLGVLERQSAAEDMTAALETGKEMLVEILEFVTQHCGTEAVSRDLSRVCDLRDTLRDMKNLISRSFWASLFRVRSTHEDLRQQAYRQLGHEFAEVFRDLLSVLDGHFNSSANVSEWQSSCRILIEDFRRRW